MQSDIEQHLKHCTACENQLNQILSENAFLDQARSALQKSIPDETIEVTKPSGTGGFAQQFPNIQGYNIIQVVGQGGMGIVYEAIQAKLDRRVALKVLPAILGGPNSDAVARFRREATAAAKLHHTNIIPVYDYGESRDGCYYAMELIDGDPLDTIIKRLSTIDVTEASPVRIAEILLSKSIDGSAQNNTTTEISPQQSAEQPQTRQDQWTDRSNSTTRRGKVYYQHVARWIADVASALEYSHKGGIIHRDIKPSNLILSRDGRLMVADFGLAMQPDEKTITVTGSLLGTVRYMSPEQAMAKRLRIDHRTDIWSLGATLYELLTFEPAFSGIDQKEVLAKIITTEPRPPGKLHPSVPRDLETICLKCLEKSTDARYNTAGDLQADLNRYIEDLPIIAQPPGLVTKIARFIRRNRATSVAIISTILILTITSIAISYRNTQQSERIEHLYKEATIAVTEQNWHTADTAIDELFELEPESAKAIFFKAWSRYNRANHADPARAAELLAEADELCKQARKIDPDMVSGLNTHGIVLKKLDRFPEAIQAYERAKNINPEYYPLWVNLATVYALNHDLDQCEEALITATNLAISQEKEMGVDFKNQKPQAVQAWRNLASLQLHLGKPDAIHTINAAIQWNRTDASSYLIRAKILLHLKDNIDHEEALYQARSANDRTQQPDPRINRILALAHLRNENHDAAIEHAYDALTLGDFPAFNHLIIAIASAQKGDLVSARNRIKQAEKNWPKDLTDAKFRVTAPAGVLWFDSAGQLEALRAKAGNLLPEG